MKKAVTRFVESILFRLFFSKICSTCKRQGDSREMLAIVHGIDSSSDSWIEYIHRKCVDQTRQLGFLTEHSLGFGNG